ncbi:MAG: VWA domain-containing protein, partial [Myxococcales bacterium]|nr:VWA domain-containing protein [Myxococcales bacterium]
MSDLFPFALERPDLLILGALALPIVALAFWSRRKLSLRRRLLVLGLRLALLATLVLAVSGLTFLQAVDALGVVFVVDRSASVGGSGQAQAKAFIEAALEHQAPDDRAGIVVFGADAVVEAEPTAQLGFHGVEAVPSPHQTDIAGGLRLATALLPSDRARRLVVLTDGEQTRGDAAAQALLTAGDDLTLSVVALGGDDGPDVLLEDLLAPARVDEGAPFDVRVVLGADAPADGSLRLYRNDEYLGEMPVTLDGDGRSKVLTFRQEARKAGLYRFRATFEARDSAMDSQPQNNQVMTTVQVTGRPRVLIADSEPDAARPLATVLRGEGLDVEGVAPAAFPPGLAELRPYAAVFLSEVPAFALSTRQQKALQTYVRDLGRGLVMVGGPNSFGVGGYYHTPVEETLPVGMDIEDKTRFPKLGMVHAIDKSCSMGGGAGSKLFLAKEAALQTVDLLSESDMLGIIGFDGAASFIVPLQELHDKQKVIDDVASIRPGGGTDIYPALDRAIQALRESDAALKHIILLSDGDTSPGAYQPLIQNAFRNDRITLTSIGIGTDSDRQTMEEFARWGGGNYYLVTDASAIPAIFTRETLLATREFLKEEDVHAQRNGASELVAGLRTEAMPVLHGYVVTTPKERATVPLVLPADEHEDPLLAHWRYGLGRSVAWTSDARGRWASEWVGKPAYTQLWGQIARWVVARGGDEGLQLETTIREGRLEVTVDAFDDGGGFRNFLAG